MLKYLGSFFFILKIPFCKIQIFSIALCDRHANSPGFFAAVGNSYVHPSSQLEGWVPGISALDVHQDHPGNFFFFYC